MTYHGKPSEGARCPARWRKVHGGEWHYCMYFGIVHQGACRCECGDVAPMVAFAGDPTPDGPLLPYPGRVEPLGGPRLRLAWACWRYGVWDDRVAEARAAFQASIDQGQPDTWWERHLTIALGARAKWKHRMDRYGQR